MLSLRRDAAEKNAISGGFYYFRPFILWELAMTSEQVTPLTLDRVITWSKPLTMKFMNTVVPQMALLGIITRLSLSPQCTCYH